MNKRPFDKEGADVPKGTMTKAQGWNERGQLPTQSVSVDAKGWSIAKGNTNIAKVGRTQ